MIESIPNMTTLNTYIHAKTILSPNKDYIMLTSKISIKPYRWFKTAISKDFIDIVMPNTIQVWIEAVNCRQPYYKQYYIRSNTLHIYTNARDYNNRKYVTLNILIIGERKDTYVINKLAKEL